MRIVIILLVEKRKLFNNLGMSKRRIFKILILEKRILVIRYKMTTQMKVHLTKVVHILPAVGYPSPAVVHTPSEVRNPLPKINLHL